MPTTEDVERPSCAPKALPAHRRTVLEIRPEGDCPGIANIRITADELRAGGEETARVGEQLVRAGLARLHRRNREILLMRLGLTSGAMTMAETAHRFGLSRERIRQIQNRELDRALVPTGTGVRRGWHEARDRLREILVPDGQTTLDPGLVLAFVELVMPQAPRELTVTLVGRLCGGKAADCRDLLATVETCHREREQRTSPPSPCETAGSSIVRRLTCRLPHWHLPASVPERNWTGPIRSSCRAVVLTSDHSSW